MATFTKLASGSWRARVRHKGRYVSESFQRREDARRWATEMEGRIDRGEHFDGNPSQLIPMGRIIKIAVATACAMRQEEICRVTWSDLNASTDMLTIRDRKDPREKKGNDQRIPLLAVSGYAGADRGAPTTTRPSARSSPAPAGWWRSRTCISTTCATRAPASCSKPLPDRAGLARHRPQGLQDAAPLHARPAGDAARDGRPTRRLARGLKPTRN